MGEYRKEGIFLSIFGPHPDTLGENFAFAADGARFFATNADNGFGRLWASIRRVTGGVVRLWGFNDASYKTEPAVNFPATDVLFASWYEEYSNEIGTLE